MSQGHTINTHAEDVDVEVRLDGEVVVRSKRPVLLEETGLPTTYYFPKSDLVVDARPIELSTHCPFKGDASYWTIEVGGRAHDAIAWSYEQPTDGAEEIAGHVAFFADRADISVVDSSIRRAEQGRSLPTPDLRRSSGTIRVWRHHRRVR